jgi:hypothetical protein
MPHKSLGLLLLAACACAGQNSLADGGLKQAYQQAAYKVRPSGDGTYRSASVAQRLDLEFSPAEARLKGRNPQDDVAFRLKGYGYARHLRTPDPAQLSANGNRVEYRRGGITEWYVNGPAGLEQGFTLTERPPGATDNQPLTIALNIDGEMQPAMSPARDAVLLQSDGRTVFRYAGLEARDARGREVASHLEVRGREIRLVVEDRGANYPLTIDPTVSTWTETTQLTDAAGLGGLDGFGSSVAVSGNIAVIGAPSSSPGAAYVFVFSGGSWSEQQKLTASDAASNDAFGVSVAVSGSTLVVGASGQNSNRGAAYVFVQNGSSWSQQQKLTASDGVAGDGFGYSVSISGNKVLVGASEKNTNTGAAYVFVSSNGTWSQQQVLNSSNSISGDVFGVAVSISGNIALVGASEHNHGQGAAYTFTTNGTVWMLQQELTASDGAAGAFFGQAVSLSGATAVIGASQSAMHGEAYIFSENQDVWSQQLVLVASDASNNAGFGNSVSISGKVALVGAQNGAAYIFAGKTWLQQAEVTNSGTSVAVNGGAALVGTEGGFVNTYRQAGSTIALSASPNPAVFGTPVTLTAMVSPTSATGSVTFYDGVTVLGSSPVSNGTATLTTRLLVAGERSLTALYAGSGSAVYASSVSPAYAEGVTTNPVSGFSGSSNPATGNGPRAIAVGDFNEDGDQDLAVANYSSNNVTVLLGNGAGAFSPARNSPFGAGTNPFGLAVGDFNGDGHADLAVTGQGSDNVSILLGDGQGGFTPGKNPIAVAGQPNPIVVADFNGDGIADLAVGSFTGNSVTVLLGSGSGGFQSAAGSPIAVGTNPDSLAAADFNADGIPDLAVANQGSDNVTILMGVGDGTFTQQFGPFPVGLAPLSLAAADFNGDGKLDLAISISGLVGEVAILEGNGKGNFATGQGSPFAVGYPSASVVVGDFNADGKPDLAFSAGNGNNVPVLLGNGNGGFSAASWSPVPVGSNPIALAVGEFNGDGAQDLAVANYAGANVSVLLGETVTEPAFFAGAVNLGSNVEYLQFPDNIVFGYYSFVASSIFYHYDMGYEAFIPGSSGTDIYLFDFTSGHWWYTNAGSFPSLYDFTLNAWIYYLPNTKSPGHYTTNPRYFSNLTTAQIFTL